MGLDDHGAIDPWADRKEGAGIANEHGLSIAETLKKRRSRAATRAGYTALAVRVLALALAGWLIFTYAFLITQVSGQGMFPALKDGDLCVVFRRQTALPLGETYQTNDIVVYRADGRRRFGRVAAVAGDEVAIARDGGLTVNGVSQTGEIMFPTYPREGEPVALTVPEGSLYILGDHRTDTVDSRDTGAVSIDTVEGKVISILRRRGL